VIVVAVIQAVLLAVMVFLWDRQRRHIAWIDEWQSQLAPLIEALRVVIATNVPIHGLDDVDGVRRDGRLIPSKVGIEQLILVWDQVSSALRIRREEIRRMSKAFKALATWEAEHPAPTVPFSKAKVPEPSSTDIEVTA